MEETIHSSLREYRQKAGLTQQALAEKLGVTRQTINAIEQSKYQPTLHLAIKCATLFSVPVETLFNFK